jgi:hypothetical protein
MRMKAGELIHMGISSLVTETDYGATGDTHR